MEALAHLRAAGELLARGDQRLRWYEESEQTESTRARNRDLSPFSGALNAVAPQLEFSMGELQDGRPALIGRVKLDRLREGPPHTTHGGVVAGLFDEMLGAAQRLTGRPGGVTGRLVVRFRKPTPLGEDLEFRSWVHDDRQRRLVMRADCRVHRSEESSGSTRELLTAEAEAVFLRVDFAGMERSMRGRASGSAPAAAPPSTADPSA